MKPRKEKCPVCGGEQIEVLGEKKLYLSCKSCLWVSSSPIAQEAPADIHAEVKQLKPAPNIDEEGGVLDTLRHELKKFEQENDLACVMVIGMKKDGSPTLSTSKTSGMEKSYMIAFINAWFAKWMYGEA